MKRPLEVRDRDICFGKGRQYLGSSQGKNRVRCAANFLVRSKLIVWDLKDLKLCDISNCLHKQHTPTGLDLIGAKLYHTATMAKSKQAKATKKHEETVQQPTPPVQEESDAGSDVEFVIDGDLEKDEAEEDFKLNDEDAEEGEDSDAQGGLEGLDDADVRGTIESQHALPMY
jgi:hypothetical protein